MGAPKARLNGMATMKPDSGARAIAHRKPMREVNDDAGKEARLCNSEEKAHQIELARCLHQCSGRREQSPGDENAREPFASAPSFHE